MNRRSPRLSDSALSDPCRDALAHLLEAQAFATTLDCSNLDFACQIAGLHVSGVRESALRALFHQGLIIHLSETTRPRQKRRTFRSSMNTHFTDLSCFILTTKGVALAESMDEQRCPRTVRGQSEKSIGPHYDPERRTLFFSGRVVKRFRVPAENQELILLAFEELCWPRHIDDPIPVAAGIDQRKRLERALFKLNHKQQHQLLHFGANGKGTGVTWSAIGV